MTGLHFGADAPGSAGTAGVRVGTPVVGATPVEVTAGDCVWTAGTSCASQRLTPLCPAHARLLSPMELNDPSTHCAVLPFGGV